jgi:hypothetical protein
MPEPSSVPPRPLQVATALCLRGILIIAACPSAATRCGRCCITSIVAPRTGPRQPHGFSGEHVRTSLRRCCHQSMTCHGLVNAIRPSREVVEAMECPALNGYPEFLRGRSLYNDLILCDPSERCVLNLLREKHLALWYSPGCKIIVLSTTYVNRLTFQYPEKRVQRCARLLRSHSTSPM